MKRTIIKSPQAEHDLAEVADFIAGDNTSAALRFLDAAEEAFQGLAEMPQMGSQWESQNRRFTGLRAWSIQGFESFLIFYRAFKDRIEIVRVLHGARDLENLLG